MTKTTNIYIDSVEQENLYILSLDEYYYEFLEKPEFEVRYTCNDSNFKVNKLTQKVDSLEKATEIINMYIDFIKRFTEIKKVKKQIISHEDITATF